MLQLQEYHSVCKIWQSLAFSSQYLQFSSFILSLILLYCHDRMLQINASFKQINKTKKTNKLVRIYGLTFIYRMMMAIYT